MRKVKDMIEATEKQISGYSTSERCAVACALDDIRYAPAPFHRFQDALERLNQSQLDQVNEIRRKRGLFELRIPGGPRYY